MATKATINKYLHGYPDHVGNKKRVVVILNGPTAYGAGGVGVDAIAHVFNIHQVQATLSAGTYICVPRINGTNDFGKAADLRLMFIDVATGLQPADNTDLSAVKVRLALEGTN